MEDENSRTLNYACINLENQDRVWRNVLLNEAWRRRLAGLQSLQQYLLPPPPPCREFVIPPSVVPVDYYWSLTSFLEVDHSFFSPWNWSPNLPDNNASRKLRMIFQPDSFFCADQEMYNRKSGKEVGI